ncbi:MAG: hypothetical protein WAZ19_02275 [Anaerolineae bacterium]
MKLEIKIGTIIKEYKQMSEAYNLMYIGQVVGIDDNKVLLNPCVLGYKLKHMDEYLMYNVQDSEVGGLVEDLTDGDPEPVSVEDYDYYMEMLTKKVITKDEFISKLSAALVTEVPQEQTPAEEEFE